MKRLLKLWGIILAALLIGVFSSSSANTVRGNSGPPPQPPQQPSPRVLAELDQRSTHIIIGTVKQIEPLLPMTEPHGGTYSRVTVSVGSIIRGELNTPEIIIIHEVGYNFDGPEYGWSSPEFRMGETAKLYLNMVTRLSEALPIEMALAEKILAESGTFFQVVLGNWGKVSLSQPGSPGVTGSAQEVGYD